MPRFTFMKQAHSSIQTKMWWQRVNKLRSINPRHNIRIRPVRQCYFWIIIIRIIISNIDGLNCAIVLPSFLHKFSICHASHWFAPKVLADISCSSSHTGVCNLQNIATCESERLDTLLTVTGDWWSAAVEIIVKLQRTPEKRFSCGLFSAHCC